MKAICLIASLLTLLTMTCQAQDKFTLEPGQSMIMTGKGPGQDATINPYFGEDCFALVKNTGKKEFSIRIQQKGTILQIIPIQKGQIKKIKLLKGHELYLDSNTEGVVKAKVDYEPIN